jgi:hypothetical protein
MMDNALRRVLAACVSKELRQVLRSFGANTPNYEVVLLQCFDHKYSVYQDNGLYSVFHFSLSNR